VVCFKRSEKKLTQKESRFHKAEQPLMLRVTNFFKCPYSEMFKSSVAIAWILSGRALHAQAPFGLHPLAKDNMGV